MHVDLPLQNSRSHLRRLFSSYKARTLSLRALFSSSDDVGFILAFTASKDADTVNVCPATFSYERQGGPLLSSPDEKKSSALEDEDNFRALGDETILLISLPVALPWKSESLSMTTQSQ